MRRQTQNEERGGGNSKRKRNIGFGEPKNSIKRESVAERRKGKRQNSEEANTK